MNVCLCSLYTPLQSSDILNLKRSISENYFKSIIFTNIETSLNIKSEAFLQEKKLFLLLKVLPVLESDILVFCDPNYEMIGTHSIENFKNGDLPFFVDESLTLLFYKSSEVNRRALTLLLEGKELNIPHLQIDTTSFLIQTSKSIRVSNKKNLCILIIGMLRTFEKVKQQFLDLIIRCNEKYDVYLITMTNGDDKIF